MKHKENCPKGIYYRDTAFPDVPEGHPAMVAHDAAAPACTCGYDAAERVRNAAPDLLEALRDAASWLREHAPYVDPQVRQGYDSTCDGIEAAITKAKG